MKKLSYTPFYKSDVEMYLTIFLVDDVQKERLDEWNTKRYKELDGEFFSIFEHVEKESYIVGNSEVKIAE